jgi:probable F420-dependent oxidoreductase
MADGELHIGTRLDPGVPHYNDLREATELAERLGYEAVWVRDHVSLADTTGQEECHEVWTIMTALAAQTERIKVGSLVLCTPFRNPALLAKMGATLDHLSGGRLILGMGAGHKEAEFREYGYDFPRAGDRVTMLDEAAAIVRLMWTEHRPSFEGRFYRIDGALNVPTPVQQPSPTIMIGGDGPRMLRVIARRADAWNIAGGPEEYLGLRERMAEACAAVGRDPDTLRHIVSIPIIVDRSEARARERLGAVCDARPGQPYLRDRIWAGSPQQIADRIQPLLDAGVRELITNFWEMEQQAEQIETFAETVWPLLRERVPASA